MLPISNIGFHLSSHADNQEFTIGYMYLFVTNNKTVFTFFQKLKKKVKVMYQKIVLLNKTKLQKG